MLKKFSELHRIPERRAPTVVLATLCLCALWLVTLYAAGNSMYAPRAVLVGIAVAIAPALVYVWLALRVDPYEKEPGWMLVAAFLWGAIVAVFLAARFNPPRIEGNLWASPRDLLKAACVEEMAKAAPLFLFFFWKRDEFDDKIDGVIYGVMIGLGFAMSENVRLYAHAWNKHVLSALMFKRGVLSPFSHPMFTALTGIGLGVARETLKRPRKITAPLVGLAAAILLHFEWNWFVQPWIILPTFMAMIAVVAYELAGERGVIRENLLSYVEGGRLTPDELEKLCRFGGRSRGLWTAMKVGDKGDWRRERRFQQAATELAFHAWRISRGISQGPKKDAEREAEYLGQIAANRVHHAAPSLSA